MNSFVIDEKYTSKETGIEYYFYSASANLEKGTFWQKDSKSFHELDYSIMQPNKDLNGNYTIKHDCVEYSVSKEIKERFDAIVKEAQEYSN